MNEITSNTDHNPASAESQGTTSNHQGDSSSAPRQGHTKKPSAPILNRDQCLAGLSQLPSLLTIGMLKPGQANAMRGVFNDIIKHQRTDHHQPGNISTLDELIQAVRQSPGLIRSLEPLLSEDQLKLLMDAIRGDENGET